MICISCCSRLDGIDKFVSQALKTQEHFIQLISSVEDSNNPNLKLEPKSLLQQHLLKNKIIEPDSSTGSDAAELEMKLDPMLFVQCSLEDSINAEDGEQKCAEKSTLSDRNFKPESLLMDHNYYNRADEGMSSPTILQNEIKTENESGSDSNDLSTSFINNGNNNDMCNCALCDQSFIDHISLRNHMWRHLSKLRNVLINSDSNIMQSDLHAEMYPETIMNCSGDEPIYLPCPICGKMLSTKSNLKVHLETHSPKGKYACDICGRVFKSETNLFRHKEYHTGIQFTCEVCRRVYPTNSTLRAHSITHSDARPHACSLCNKTFKRNQDLKFHLNQHTGARPYQCPYCPKAFASSGNCFSHRKRMHPNEVERDKERAAAIVR